MVAAPEAKKTTKKKPTGRPMVFGMRAHPEWKEWLDRYAVSRRMTIADLIDRLLEEDARRNGFDTPPMR